VVAAGLADSAEPVPYARGTLVLWARNDSPVQPLSIDSLRSPSLRTVAVANAEHAPYGRAAKAALEKLGLTEALKGKLVVAENIAQTAQYADSGNADVGLISLTSALTPRLSSTGNTSRCLRIRTLPYCRARLCSSMEPLLQRLTNSSTFCFLRRSESSWPSAA
jgi:molybdate transport system substrate-binding protein